jgi:hypothetical protein
MKKKLVIIGITLMLLSIGLSGCTDDNIFKITGTAFLPELYKTYENNLPGNGLEGIYLLDLSYNELANDTDSDPNYIFSVEPNKSYIIAARYNGGQAIAAVTPTITSDLVQDISLDTEVARNLIIATDSTMNNLEPTSLSKPLDDLLADAYQEVIYLNAFYNDRNNNRNADRIADAVHALTLDKLNQGDFVEFEDVNAETIRAYGGGLQGIHSLSDMLSNPKPPLDPHFIFTRYSSQEEIEFGMSDLENTRWDYIGTNGGEPDITIGGNAVTFFGKTSSVGVTGIWKTVLGSTEDFILLTPYDMQCWDPSWSPDQAKIAFRGRYITQDSGMQPYNIFVMNADGSGLKQITHYIDPLIHTEITDTQGASHPSWSPDGSEIIFDTYIILADDTIINTLEKINVDGTNQRTFFDGTLTGYWFPMRPSWSPDGSRIVFDALPSDENDTEIIVVPNDFETDFLITINSLTDNAARDSFPSWSYDGRFIIFSSDRGGELSTFPGVEYLDPFYVINSYTGKLITNYGDFADAGWYYYPSFTATEAGFIAAEGVPTDDFGDAIITPDSDTRCYDSPSEGSLYQISLPIENEMYMRDPETAIDHSVPPLYGWD